jgi:hypothetical protein
VISRTVDWLLAHPLAMIPVLLTIFALSMTLVPMFYSWAAQDSATAPARGLAAQGEQSGGLRGLGEQSGGLAE